MTPQDAVLARLHSDVPRGPVVVLSGRHEPQDETRSRLEWARRLAPLPLLAEGAHTREELERTLAMAGDDVTLVTSNYHVPRAFLTAVAILGTEPQVRVWMAGVPGTLDPWPQEQDKIREYQRTRDCATWEAGLAYLAWRGW